MPIHEPEFPVGAALFIIWCRPRYGRQFTVAAGGFTPIRAAWDAVQGEYPQDELTLQHGARVLHKREPMQG